MYMLNERIRKEVAKHAKHPGLKAWFALDDEDLEQALEEQANELRKTTSDSTAIVAFQTLVPLMMENEALQHLGLMGHSMIIPLIENLDDLQGVAAMEWSMGREALEGLSKLLELQFPQDGSGNKDRYEPWGAPKRSAERE